MRDANMNVTIIHHPGCPRCDIAIDEFTRDGHAVELREDLCSIADHGRRNGMMVDLIENGGDKDAFPQVFIDDRFVHWKPKGE